MFEGQFRSIAAGIIAVLTIPCAVGATPNYTALETLSTGGAFGPLAVQETGKFFGFTFSSTLFALSHSNGKWTDHALATFGGGVDGAYPSSGLTPDMTGNGVLYGEAIDGGGNKLGTIFKLMPPHSGVSNWTETPIYNFCRLPNCADGTHPVGGLITDTTGALYGVSQNGGPNAGWPVGVVFKLTPPAAPDGVWTETVLHAFGTQTNDGAQPVTGLLMDAKGALYGATVNGGTNWTGIVYKLTPPSNPSGAWTEDILWTFCRQTNCPDGGFAFSNLVADKKGALYGIASDGVTGLGVVYKVAPPKIPGGSWTESVLHNFAGHGDGALLNGLQMLLIDKHGTIYGTTAGNFFASDSGSIFQVSQPTTPGGSYGYSVIHSFTGDPSGGAPSGITFGRKGKIFGTAGSTLFEVIP